MKRPKHETPLFFAVCINNAEYPTSLELQKIYRVINEGSSEKSVGCFGGSAKFRLDFLLEMVEALAGRIEGTLLFLGTAMVHKRFTVIADHVVEPCIDGAFA